jgi:hypothetical protein
LIVEKDKLAIHFFVFKNLDTKENYGQVYIQTTNIKSLYQDLLAQNVVIQPNGQLTSNPWGQ